jgi:flagellar motor switch protein FliN
MMSEMANEIRNAQIGIDAVLGSTRLRAADVATIGEGTILTLDRLAGSPIDIVAEGTTIARGEVVVVDEVFGVRVTEVLDG